MKKFSIILAILVGLIPLSTLGATSFNSVLNSDPSSTTSPLTFSFTNTSGDYLLVGFTMLAKGTPSSVTYNGVAMTQIISNTTDSNENVYLYGLAGPATGANNVSISWGGSHTVAARAYSISGAAQTNQPDASSTSASTSATNLALPLTTKSDGSWVAGFCRTPTGGTAGAGSNTTKRNSDTTATAFLDSNFNPVSPAGSVTMNCTDSGTGRMIFVAASLAPAASTPTVTAPTPQVIWW